MLNKNSSKKQIHFLHIGKTGGSAIKHVLKQNLETLDYCLSIHGHNSSIKDIPKGEKIIFFLRDPLSRFVSGFYSRKRKGKPLYNSEWNTTEKEVFLKFNTPNELALALVEKDDLALEAMSSIEHLQHYAKWYGSLEYFMTRLDDILFIGFQESLDDDFLKLKTLLGLDEALNLPTDEVTAHRNPIDLDKRLEPLAMEVLSQWYAEDIKFIALCKKLTF